MRELRRIMETSEITQHALEVCQNLQSDEAEHCTEEGDYSGLFQRQRWGNFSERRGGAHNYGLF